MPRYPIDDDEREWDSDAEDYVDESFDEGDERNTDAWAMTPPR